MEGGGQQGGGPDRDQDAAAVSNTTQDDPLLPPTDSSSPCTMEWLKPQHADVTNRLRQLHQDSRYFDFTLKLKEGPLRFSRILMASMSPFFHNLVTVDMEESRSNEVNMEHVSQDTWTCITSFYFSSNNLVSMDNVQDVLEASHMYGLEKLVQYSSEFLHSHCCADNCLDLLQLAKHFDLDSLGQKARRVLADNFSTLCKDENFLTLEKADLLQLLEKEEVVTTEDDLCRILLAWMEKNNTVTDTCIEVFQQLRLKLISAECFRNFVLSHSVCKRSPGIWSLVKQEKSRRAHSISLPPTQEKARKRRPGSAKNSLLVLGQAWNGVVFLYVWSFDERRWTTFPGPSLEARRSMSCTALEDTVIIRGWTSNRSTYLFDLGTQMSSTGPDLLQGRVDESMTSIGHTAYVVGGQGDKFSSLSSIEEYSEASGQWTATGNLQKPDFNCAVAALGDTILVVGRYKASSTQLVQTFNVHTKSAAVLDVPLPRAVYHVTTTSHGKSAFFVGHQGELVQFQEMEGKIQMTSQAVLENFSSDTHLLRLQATSSCVRVINGADFRFAFCWDFNGKEIEHDCALEGLPVYGQECIAAVEVNIPHR